MNLVKPDNEILHKPTLVVTDIQTQVVPHVKDMRRTLIKSGGVALAANQVGIPYRFFIDKSRVYINPIIEVLDKEQVDGREGCLSLPGMMYLMKRYKSVSITYTDLQGKQITETVTMPEQAKNLKERNELTRCLMFQHEVDHLDGFIISKKGKPYNGSIGKDKDEEDTQVVDPRTLPLLSLEALQKHVAKERERKSASSNR